MSFDQAHRGSRTPGPMAQPIDRRIGEIDEGLRAVESGSPILAQLGFLRDSLRVLQPHTQALGYPGHFVRGVVIHAIPYANWYKVQCGDGHGWIMACGLEHTGLVPLGARAMGVYPPGSSVLVYKHRGVNHGHIVGAIPPTLADGTIINPDWVTQGGGSGIKRERAHMFPIQHMYRQGGVIDWSANRPLDETAFMKGFVTPTGIAMLLSDWEAFLRVNEQCGLFLSIYDSHARLAGVQLDIESAVQTINSRDDEGESRYFNGIAAYPWEAIGLYEHGVDFTKENDDAAIQYDIHEAKVDLIDQDLCPIFRSFYYGGYLGQGMMRGVMKPSREGGTRKYPDEEKDEGLFREHVGLDGSYSLISAKRVHIGKRVKIAVPKEITIPEDKKRGDDAEKGNYKFSSKFGGAEEHKIKDVKVEGELKHMRRVAAVQDVVAYLVNWQALHPFHYHKGDYYLPEESELSDHFQQVVDHLDFGVLESRTYMDDPSPKKLRIDHRYGQVDYFERESFIVFHDDGSVQLGCGFGSQISMAGGGISLEAPGQIRILPGTELVAMAQQVCMRAKRSMDFSANEKDIRFKAERNMQFLAGNSGRGGIMLESKGRGSTQIYQDKYGEDVIAAGIVMKSKQGLCALLAKDIYLRTGGADLGEGDIEIDASKGNRKCYVYAREFNTFTTQAVQFYYGPVDESSNVDKVYYFGKETCIMETALLIKKKLISYGPSGGAILNGGCLGTKAFATAGVMADKKGMFLGKVPPSLASTIAAACATASAAVDALHQGGTLKHQFSYVQKYYQQYMPGHTETIRDIGFSFRDPPGEPVQYKTSQLKFPETRWQQMVRFGMASGGVAWVERPVEYQGQETYPWPGKKKWKEDDVFLQLRELKMFETGANYDKDRSGPYEDPQLADFDPVTMEGNYKVNRS